MHVRSFDSIKKKIEILFSNKLKKEKKKGFSWKFSTWTCVNWWPEMHRRTTGHMCAALVCGSGANEFSSLQQNSCTSARRLLCSDALWRPTPALPFRLAPLSKADLWHGRPLLPSVVWTNTPAARMLARSLSHQPDNASLASNATMLKGVQRWPSPQCWSSRCSRRTSETPVLQCPTSGSECSSPLFLPRCCRWWATCGPPPSSGLREEKYNGEIGS